MENPPVQGESSPSRMRAFDTLAGAAREMCASCPLWAECLRDAVLHTDPYGYAAATTADDRRWIRRELRMGDQYGDLGSADGEEVTLGDLMAEQRRHPDASQQEMAVRLGCSRSTVSRRLALMRSRMDDDAERSRHAGSTQPELGAILDAFDALQEYLAADHGVSVRIGSAPVKSGSLGIGPLSRSGKSPYKSSHSQLQNPNRESAAVGADGKISFSLDDPAMAVREAVLWPLLRAAAPAALGAEQLAAMLTTVPGSGMTAEVLDGIRQARRVVESLLPDTGELPPRADNGLMGSVSVALATSDPVTALQQAFLEPLLRSLVGSLANTETVVTMLAAVPGSGISGAQLEAIRGARRSLAAQLVDGRGNVAEGEERHDGASASAGVAPATGTPAGSARPRVLLSGIPAQQPSPSIRAAVERTVATIAEPFTGKDVTHEVGARQESAPGPYRDPSKAVSNVLSAMVKAGRLKRLSRGTYVRVA
ncbi:WhiB family transcriptional regulator [Streptomyces sp. H27-D2]|uniref:WhiB family transcriptional regulator n=1 Tax=Streptomyces sp. H27-D2 TaxID=3046304 RepID=UPI002DBA157E|nr:WhiB family transcriptional regulator [Streptomyces sp. H27-D2]MEC4018241.1 WhiB family transcriptional regulator [Streptomyces sp. H27-D2]